MRLDIRAKTADEQIKARETLTRCLPESVFWEVFCNLYASKPYFIAYKRNGGVLTGEISLDAGKIQYD